MEMLLKRRASSELQNLLSAVQTDYEFFSHFDAIFESPTKKRPRNDYTSYKPKPSPLVCHQPLKSKIWNSRENHPTKSNNVLTRHVTSVSPDHWSRNQFETGFQLTRIGLDTSLQTFYDSAGELSPSTPPPPASRQTKVPVLGWEKADITEIRNLQRQSPEDEFQQAMDALSEDDKPTNTANILGDDQAQGALKVRGANNARFETTSQATTTSTQIIYNNVSRQNLPYELAFLATRVEKEEFSTANISRSSNQNKQDGTSKLSPINPLQNKPITIEVDDDVSTSTANEKPVNKPRQQLSPVETTSSVDSVSSVQSPSTSPDHIRLSPNMELWPNYVITKVGSLLWLGKDMVYPITLGEIRRRVQDPENFSFQMLIAYVRHSRAKGRQFLNYWDCQPTGKTSRPNVLSKLCEADARQLVEGIKEVNEQYFPTEKLAQNAAKNMLEKLTGEDKSPPSENNYVQNNVERIEKSRSILQLLNMALTTSEEDEKFEKFNVATHNIGLANIKYSLKFLETILESVQNNMKRGHIDTGSSLD